MHPERSWPFALPANAEPPLDADRLILWLARRQWRTLVGGAAFGIIWMLSIALVPAAIGRATDALVAHDADGILTWAAAILGLGLLSALSTDGRHWFAVRNWLTAVFRGGLLADRAVRRTGPALTREMPVGEAIATFSTDFERLGGVFDVFARFCGAVVSFVAVSVILLRGSMLLGLVMLIGGPVLLASLALVVRPLQRRQQAQRSESGRLTTLAADTVAGLRVLRGIGGEDAFLDRYAAQSGRLRTAGVRLAGLQASLDAAQVLLPGIFVVIVTGLGAHLTVAGEITPGQLVAYYGYTAFLTMPLRTATEFVDELITTRVAASRICRVLASRPDHAPGDDRSPALVRDQACAPLVGELHDPTSGATIRPGILTAIVSDRPQDSAAITHRLARTLPGRHGVTLGEGSIDDLDIAQVRATITISEADPHLFSGPVRRELLCAAPTPTIPDAAGPAGAHTRISAALTVADGQDVLDSIEGGLDGVLQERGRSLSGGQRQRLALARALLTQAPVLILVEPTSAVDAHTEARIAPRLAAHRAGLTTVVVTASPLLLDSADEVLLVQDGRVCASGTHADLVAADAAYRDVVLRGGDE